MVGGGGGGVHVPGILAEPWIGTCVARARARRLLEGKKIFLGLGLGGLALVEF